MPLVCVRCATYILYMRKCYGQQSQKQFMFEQIKRKKKKELAAKVQERGYC